MLINLQVTEEQKADYESLIFCMDIVNDWVEASKQAGNALSEIKENKYYKHWYPSFRRFVEVHYSMSDVQANTLITFSRVAKVLASKKEIKLLSLVEKSGATVTQPIPKKASDEQVVAIVVAATNDGKSVPTQKGISEAKSLILNENKKIKLNENINKNKKISNIFSNINRDAMSEILYCLFEAVEATKWHLDNLKSNERRNSAIVKNVNKFDKYFKQAMKFLNLHEGVTYKEAKKAYRELAKELHPDRQGGSDEAMQKLNEAFAVIEEYRKWKQKN